MDELEIRINKSSLVEKVQIILIFKYSIILETAINVGYACQLINDDMEVLTVEGHTQKQVDKDLRRCLDIISGVISLEESDKRLSGQMQAMNVVTIR